MKKFYVFILIAVATMTANAQTFKDTFDSNILGWTEFTDKDGEALIQDGVMHLEGKKPATSNIFTSSAGSFVLTSCYAPIDVKTNFELKIKAKVKKIGENNKVGIVLDYYDDYNFVMFTIDDKYVYYEKVKEGYIVARKRGQLKLTDKKKAELELSIKTSFDKLEMSINNMLVMDIRFIDLISNGIALFASGAQEVDFDDLEIIQ